MLSKKYMSVSLFVIFVCMSHMSSCMFFSYNGGTKVSGTIEEKSASLTHNGDYYAMQKVVIDTNTFDGNGLIDAPTVIIKTKNFAFVGTIRCQNNCIICSEEPFDQAQFMQEGPGIFNILMGKEHKDVLNIAKIEEHFSLDPLKRALLEYPTRHPIQTGIIATILVSALVHKMISK